MTDELENTPAGSPLDDFVAFTAQHPEIAQAVQAEVEKHITAAEETLGAGRGNEKKLFASAAAKHTFEQAADGIYDAVDLFAGFPGPVDALVKNLLIPALPGLIDSAVSLFNSTGLFQHGEPAQGAEEGAAQ